MTLTHIWTSDTWWCLGAWWPRTGWGWSWAGWSWWTPPRWSSSPGTETSLACGETSGYTESLVTWVHRAFSHHSSKIPDYPVINFLAATETYLMWSTLTFHNFVVENSKNKDWDDADGGERMDDLVEDIESQLEISLVIIQILVFN